MQRRYKGNEIPTIEEVFAKNEEYKKEGANFDKLCYPSNGIMIKLFTEEEAENMTSDQANKEITRIFEEFIDHYMDSAIATVETFNKFKDEVDANPLQKMKNMYEVVDNTTENTEEAEDEEEVVEKDNTVEESIEAYTELQTADDHVTEEEVSTLIETAQSINPELKVLEGTKGHEPEEGETKPVLMNTDPNTGMSTIIGDADLDNESFDDMYNRIMNSDIEFDTSKPLTKSQVLEFMTDHPDQTMISEIAAGNNISTEAITGLLDVANRRMKKEDFSVYRALPVEIQKMIDKYAEGSGISPMDSRIEALKNAAAEAVIDDFLTNINLDRIQKDFSVEVEEIFNKASEDIGKDLIGYSEQKLAKYKEAVEAMEDGEKKEKMENILARIKEAYDLNELKEFCKRCKIKKFDLEKPERYFDVAMNKYADSPYKIYSISMARPILYRALNKDRSGDDPYYIDDDINAFFVAFCKQTLNMRPDNVLEHSYMYYVMYNIVLADINKSPETAHITDTFLNNIKECIANLKERNSGILY